ncbi:MAG: hypothetical protein ACYTGV_14060 [Planctomycetota bacterium]|jgi:hypothetical protein
MRRHLWIPILLLVAACGASSGEPAIIVTLNTASPDVTLATSSAFPGTLIHGPGIGPGGGGTCGTIDAFYGYRTDTTLVFRIVEQDDFCWGTDVYEIVLQNVTWKGQPGTVLIVNNGDPQIRGFGVAYFIPSGGALDLIEEIPVTQWQDDPNDNYIYLSVPLKYFSFESDTDSESVFAVAAQIERLTTVVKTDWTATLNIDFVDLP